MDRESARAMDSCGHARPARSPLNYPVLLSLVSIGLLVENIPVSSLDRCPATPNETAEAYLLGHLSPEAARAFGRHYETCPTCAATVDETERYVIAMKRATSRLRTGRENAGPER
jgi:hypothetical protein